MQKKERVVIVGANEFQNRLILKAKECGYETHVFAWENGDIGERTADCFYPISIVEKERILEKCRALQPVGVCSIASDLAAVTVNYVAQQLGLTCNTAACVQLSTNKHAMRRAFEKAGLPSPKSILCASTTEIHKYALPYPAIVKPTDRSGSRAITKLDSGDGLEKAVEKAIDQSFEKKALVEEFISGKEYSVEYISWEGCHHFLAATQKYTTGAPHFIETGHMEPANLPQHQLEKVRQTVQRALDALHIQNGASHSEIKIDAEGKVWLIEIGARMGGDCIGSDLVPLSTGYDYVKMVLDVACGKAPSFTQTGTPGAAAVYFVLGKADLKALHLVQQNNPSLLYRASKIEPFNHEVTDSATRFGYYILCGKDARDVANPAQIPEGKG